MLLCRLPFDRTADGWNLIRGRYACRRDAPHGLDKLTPRARRRWRGAAFIEAATVFQLQVFAVAEEIGGADRAIRACHGLGLVVKIGKRKIVRLRESLHISE